MQVLHYLGRTTNLCIVLFGLGSDVWDTKILTVGLALPLTQVSSSCHLQIHCWADC